MVTSAQSHQVDSKVTVGRVTSVDHSARARVMVADTVPIVVQRVDDQDALVGVLKTNYGSSLRVQIFGAQILKNKVFIQKILKFKYNP